MATTENPNYDAILDYWNSKKIVVHKRLNQDMRNAIRRVLRDYTHEELYELIDFYQTILEPGVPTHQKKYFWSYKWGLYEFLMRGVKKFDGQTLENYRKEQSVSAQSYVFKRSK